MRSKWSVLLGAFCASMVLAGCVDERIVYERPPLFETPPAGAADFVGYSNPTTKLTVCGNCHIGPQTRWAQTAHADAFKTIENHPARVAACEGCHTTNQLGNLATQTGGWLGAANDRYKDVQCESCHGPGLPHVQNPTRQNWPLAPLAVGTDLQTGCGQCHTGAHQPFVQEWARSRHGRIPATGVGSTATTAVGNRDACKECHTGEDALAIKFGVDAHYLEMNQVQAPGQHLPITCAVCHDPHDKKYEGQLRKSITTPVVEDNLCMKCHYKRGIPDPTTFRGPHSPEGPMLMGHGGNWFPSMGTDTVIATHGSDRNPRLCAGCHVNKFEIRDKLTNQFVMRATGHTFEATPCVDASGVPVEGPCDRTQRTFMTCAGSQCHVSADQARQAQVRVEQRLLLLTDQLDALLRQVQSNWKQCRGSGTCPGEFHGSDGRWTIAEGAAFNYEMARATSGPRVNEIRFGAAVHNPALMEVLLIASIREVQAHYGLSLRPTVSLERTIGVN
jgi:predicted CXXCH cytochrome family protein